MQSFIQNLTLRLIAFYILAGSCAIAVAADLTVLVTGQAKGQIYIGLYEREETWSTKQALRVESGAYSDGFSATFKALPAGRYAVRLYIDENGNNKLDTRIFGIPAEPFGMSRNAPSRFGPPSFMDAAIELSESMATTINLR